LTTSTRTEIGARLIRFFQGECPYRRAEEDVDEEEEEEEEGEDGEEIQRWSSACSQ